MRKALPTVGVALVALAAAPATAVAEERVCRGSIGAVTVDNLRVPQGATCTLSRTTVKGTVKVENGATLRATSIRVVGNIQGEGARSVSVVTSRIGGSYQLVQGGGSRLDRSFVNGDVQLFSNQGTITVVNNTIDGNLQCKENSPAPTGGGNVVGGNKEDQCAGL
jgi:DUF4097 and DUF4098 domain-containing protein YvlB